MKRSERILDPIHGLIRFNEESESDRLSWRLIDQAPMQRLRRIKQLGFAEFIFPGATHSRFAHSIGVFHMARGLSARVARQLGERFNSHRAMAAKLAALLHDIGHGPFSHAFETSERQCGSDKSHEHWTLEIITHDDGIMRILKEADLSNEVMAMIDKKGKGDFYHAIVSSQFDADRLDYLQRDRYMSGIGAGGFDPDWLLECLEVSLEDGFYLNHKSQHNAEEYILARYYLYLNVYFHKTVRAAELMLADILSRLYRDPKASGISADHPLRRYHAKRNVENYLALDDMTIWQALLEMEEKARDPKLKRLAGSLYRRQFYKCFDVGQAAERQAGAAEKLTDFLKKLAAEHQNCIIDHKEFSAYDVDPLDQIKIIDQDITELSPLISAIPKKRLCRIYALDEKDIAAARALWEDQCSK